MFWAWLSLRTGSARLAELGFNLLGNPVLEFFAQGQPGTHLCTKHALAPRLHSSLISLIITWVEVKLRSMTQCDTVLPMARAMPRQPA